MLPEPYRLHHHADFSRTVRRGHRIGRRDLVVHALRACEQSMHNGDVVSSRTDGPRFGLIVNKAVGSAVVRHRVSRRLRHVCARLLDEGFTTKVDIVIRALPGAADLSSHQLENQLRGVLGKLR